MTYALPVKRQSLMEPLDVLKKYWGYDAFRPLQEDIINSVLSGKDTLGILPTGGGKSITFQVPGLMLPGVTIIVTPLISLMKDQVDNLKKRRIKAVAFNSAMSYREKNIAREKLFNDKAKFLYISPERLSSASFLQEIRPLKVSLIIIDEAHCISQWGYDFRPSYLKINRLRKLYPGAPMLALTASATKEVAEDICRQLNFREGYNSFRQSIARDNLSYIVRASDAKLFDIHRILSRTDGSGIVYVRSRKKTREIADYLNNSGISAAFYHAGLESLVKEERQTQWMAGQIRVMVATNAFGMGIDKPDVRTVIHYDMPPSLEEYYQEAGRAGRDGEAAYAVLLTSPNDKGVLRRRLTMEFPDKEIIKRVYTRACVFSHLEIGEGYDKAVEFDLVKFCLTYGMDEAVVRPSFRILGQAGYVEFIEETENSSRLMVTVDRDELYKIRLSAPIHEKILTALLRTYPGLFTDYVFISEKKLAYLSGVEQQEIYEKLVELSKARVVHYIPRRRTPLLYFPTSMEEERYVEISKRVYEDRKMTLSRRIEAMIDYAFSEGACRLDRLKTYFGEKSEGECMNCDTCRERRKKKRPSPGEKEISSHLREMFKRDDAEYDDNQISTIFGTSEDKAKRILRSLQKEGVLTYRGGIWRMSR